jgi:hypothetical protein
MLGRTDTADIGGSSAGAVAARWYWQRTFCGALEELRMCRPGKSARANEDADERHGDYQKRRKLRSIPKERDDGRRGEIGNGTRIRPSGVQ